MSSKSVLVLPAHNEASRIGKVIGDVSRYVDEVIVVDDGSADDTSQVARGAGAIVVRHRINLGKGAALKTGSEAAISIGAEVVVFMDADGQHPADKIPQLLHEIYDGGYDAVFTFRPLDNDMPAYRRFGNMTLNLFARQLFHVYLSDIWCGFRAFKASIYQKVQWAQTSYSADVEMALRVAKHKLKYCEVGIPAIYHDAYKGVSIIDGIKLLFTMLIWRITL